MNHKGTVRIASERLVLRRFEISDVDAMFANWASDAEVTRYMTKSFHKSKEVTAMVVKDWTDGYLDSNFYQWAIELKSTKEIIGSISAVKICEKSGEVEIGYCIGKKWWNNGYTTEAFTSVINFLFDQVGAIRICAKHDTNNPASGRVMQKCGLSFNGIYKGAGRNSTGEVCDLAVFTILSK